MRNQKGQSRREDTDSGGTARNYVRLAAQVSNE